MSLGNLVKRAMLSFLYGRASIPDLGVYIAAFRTAQQWLNASLATSAVLRILVCMLYCSTLQSLWQMSFHLSSFVLQCARRISSTLPGCKYALCCASIVHSLQHVVCRAQCMWFPLVILWFLLCAEPFQIIPVFCYWDCCTQPVTL